MLTIGCDQLRTARLSSGKLSEPSYERPRGTPYGQPKFIDVTREPNAYDHPSVRVMANCSLGS
jgi:hypothetical protein